MEIKQKKGISLIVLVITIIVMIILAAAIILSLNSSGIIGKANEATKQSNLANKKEAASIALAEYELKKQLGELAEGETATSYVQKALDDQGIDASDVAVDEKGNVIVGSGAKAINSNIPVGTTVTGYTLTEKSYTTDGSEHSGTKSDGTVVTGEAQTLTTNTALTWKYIGIDENGNMLIASDIPSSVPTASKLTLGYQGGYLYGPDMLNTICDELYTTSKGEARSINIDDVNNLLEYAGTKGRYYNANGDLITTSEVLTIGEIAIKLGTQLSNVKTPDGVNTWEALSKYKSDFYVITKTSNDIKNAAGKALVYYSQTYWLASPCVEARFNSDNTFFNVRHVNSSYVYAWGLFDSVVGYISNAYTVRPVVSLNSDVQFTYDSETNTCALS